MVLTKRSHYKACTSISLFSDPYYPQWYDCSQVVAPYNETANFDIIASCLEEYPEWANIPDSNGNIPLFLLGSNQVGLRDLLAPFSNLSHQNMHGNTIFHYFCVERTKCWTGKVPLQALQCKNEQNQTVIDRAQHIWVMDWFGNLMVL
jgi:hypothetical protein